MAIIGMACRVPGAANTAQLWEVLRAGRDTVREIPSERFDIDQWYPGGITTKWGGFLEDIDTFDAAFFEMSAHEAIRLDPQHRLMLQSVWTAIEDAGLSAESLAGSRTGVYTGCLATDYWDSVRAADMFDMHAAIGSGSWGLPAGRISHLLDLRGPSLGVEATCSSSLLAIHLACQDIWSGGTEIGIITSANLLLSPDHYRGLSEAGILSPRGRCHFGDASADGYVRSEAAIAVVLKPLSVAQRDGDRIYAAIRGTAVNNNGRHSETLISPGVGGQEEMLHAAYRDADVSLADVDYIEAHGAGTPRGDEVELSALSSVFAGQRRPGEPCLLGSVKTNIGHGEAAAGLAGLAKVALALKHRTIPASLHLNAPHPRLAEPDSPIAVVTSARPWPQTGRPAVAGVSSFGLSATNVHVVLQEVAQPAAPEPRPTATVLLPLSARSTDALVALAERWAVQLDQSAPETLRDLAYSASTRRTHHPHRFAVAGSEPDQLATALREFATGDQHEAGVVSEPPQVVFVFPGQGSQWVGMGRELLAGNETFATALTECAAAIKAEAGWSLLDVLADDVPIEDVQLIQPALWAMQVALAALWRAWGITPAIVIGHSMGEIAAACVSGALTIRDGAAVVCRRSELINKLARPGAMVAVGVGEQAAREAIGRYADAVSVAVINSPYSTVVAGEPEALARVVETLRADNVFCREVRVSYASHAPQVDPLRDELVAALDDLAPRAGSVPLYSTLLDQVIDGQVMGAEYWMDNLRRPVRFESAVRAAMASRRPTVFVEISPHPVLSVAVEETAEEFETQTTVVGSLLRDTPELATMLANLGRIYSLGCRPDWSVLNPGGRYTDVPHYPWQAKRFWPKPTRRLTRDRVDGSVPAITELAEQAIAAAEAMDDARVLAAAERLLAEVNRPRPATTVAVSQPVQPLTPLDRLAGLVAGLLQVAPEEVDTAAPLTRLGLDSLLASRLRLRVARDFGVSVPVREFLGNRTLMDIADIVMGH